MKPLRTNLIALLLSLGAACGPSVDYEDIEGVFRAEDEFFRYVDYPDTSKQEAFLTLEQLFRLRFAGSRLSIDREALTLETDPLPFSDSPNRVTVYGQVTERENGARIELFAKVDRLRDDLRELPESPWKYIGGDAQLENKLFEELWEVLVVRKRVDGAPVTPPPVPATTSATEGT